MAAVLRGAFTKRKGWWPPLCARGIKCEEEKAVKFIMRRVEVWLAVFVQALAECRTVSASGTDGSEGGIAFLVFTSYYGVVQDPIYCKP